ncbi:MAG: alpha/beta hydrolase [Planctomycetota bacterium]
MRSARRLALLLALPACAYMGAAARQSALAERQAAQPSLGTLKHLLETATCYVYGRVLDPDDRGAGRAVAVAAFANAYGAMELVDVMHGAGIGTHYGLNLPHVPGTAYRLLVLADADGNGQYDDGEILGQRVIAADATGADQVLGNVDILLTGAADAHLPAPVPMPPRREVRKSLFYPGGTIRELDDPIFAPEVATLGVYEPAAFTEKAPTMFYALEEDIGFKIPVVFVHGIGGSPREFAALLQRLDRRRFKPWFFYYPSGADLAQIAALLHRILFSGDAVAQDPMVPVILVAHSMGGVVVREALNLLDDAAAAHDDIHFVSIASPLGGHPSAAAGTRYGPLVVPSWRSLDPGGEFIAGLYRRPLPPFVHYRLVYAYRADGVVHFGENGDGVVPLSSQLRQEAQAEAASQRGFDATHTGILEDDHALAFVADGIHAVHTRYPEDHEQWFQQGGFVFDGECAQGPIPKLMIETIGLYVQALVLGRIQPVTDYQRHFLEAVRGGAPPTDPFAAAWLDFVARHPNPVPKRGDAK